MLNEPWPWPGIPETERTRWLAQDPARRAQFDRLYSSTMPVNRSLPPQRVYPCLYEGPIQLWATCRSEWKHVRYCEHDKHERCTRGPNDGSVSSCQSCAEFTRKPLPTDCIGSVRHMLYHVYPVRQVGTWQRNLDRLIPRLPLFNGKRIVGILEQEANATTFLDPPEAVEEYLRGFGCEFIRVVNDPAIREVSTFLPMLERLQEMTGPEHVVWYGQAKGVTRAFNPGETCHRWTNLLYELNLDYWPYVREELKRVPCVGAFKKVGYGFNGSQSSWHFSGAFGWFRLDDVFARNWRRIDRDWWGAEAWPGLHFSPDEAATVGIEGIVPSLDLYDWSYFTQTVEPRSTLWKFGNSQYRIDTGSFAG